MEDAYVSKTYEKTHEGSNPSVATWKATKHVLYAGKKCMKQLILKKRTELITILMMAAKMVKISLFVLLVIVLTIALNQTKL